MTDPDTLEAALAYIAAGLSIFPLPHAEKVPSIAWKRFQSSRASPAMVERWFATGKANLAIVMGRISGNAVALDFDDPTLARRTFPNLEELAQATFVERTSRGYHVVFRVLGMPVSTTTLTGRGLALDVKSEGSYIVAAPSTHPDGMSYRLLSPDVRIATVARSDFEALLLRLQSRQPALPGLEFHLRPGGTLASRSDTRPLDTFGGRDVLAGHEDARSSPPGRGLRPVSPRPISLACRHRKDTGP